MRILTLLFATALLMTVSNKPSSWRGLVPLHSTCDDVKRELGVESCASPISDYTLPDFRVVVEFKNETCDRTLLGWRVPLGTVTAITLSPRKEMPPSEFGLDLSKYERKEDD